MKWFQVDADTPNDPKVRAVYRALGLEGIGGLFLLWCFIADHGTRRPGWSIDSSGRPITIDDLRDASRLEQQKFDDLVAICLSVGHFEKRPWTTRKVIAIPAMASRADTYTRRSVRTSVEQCSKTVRRDFANKTTQDKTTPEIPPTPLSAKGGRRFTKADLKEARRIRNLGFGCRHDPRCPDSFACEALMASDIVARRKAAAS